MSETTSRRGATNASVSSAIAKARAEGADTSPNAVVIGNRAGVVEWANRAWSEITGFPMAETLDKPISHFLEVAGIEIGLVDFVGQHYLEGRRCNIEFPFETFDEREIRVHLEVEPVRNAPGEPEAFIATARVIPERVIRPASTDLDVADAGPNAPETTQPDRLIRASSPNKNAEVGVRQSTLELPTPAGSIETNRSVSLSGVLLPICSAAAVGAGDRVHFDLSLSATLPEIPLDIEGVGQVGEVGRRLLGAALQAIEDQWGCITVLTGLAPARRGHVSEAHPVVARPSELASGPHQFLEVHDTGPTLSPDALTRIRTGRPGTDSREIALSRATLLAHGLGATIHIDSTPGCGNQSLLLIPLR